MDFTRYAFGWDWLAVTWNVCIVLSAVVSILRIVSRLGK